MCNVWYHLLRVNSFFVLWLRLPQSYYYNQCYVTTTFTYNCFSVRKLFCLQYQGLYHVLNKYSVVSIEINYHYCFSECYLQIHCNCILPLKFVLTWKIFKNKEYFTEQLFSITNFIMRLYSYKSKIILVFCKG